MTTFVASPRCGDIHHLAYSNEPMQCWLKMILKRKGKMGINKLIKLSLLLSGLTYSAISHSAIVKLDFTTYTEYRNVCTGSSCIWYDFYSDPIVSQYQITLDTSELFNSSYSDAFNNATNFTESVTTSVSNSLGRYPNYSSKSSAVGQTYTQYEMNGDIISDMSNSASFNEWYETIEKEEREVGSLC